MSPAIANTLGFTVAGLVFLLVLLWPFRKNRKEVADELESTLVSLERPHKERVLAILKELTDDEEENELMRAFAYHFYQEVTETGRTENADAFLAWLDPHVSVWYGMPEYGDFR